MTRHLRANLLLLALTLVICCVLYPLALLVIGQTVFPSKANGSLLTNEEGKPVGSRLIAQPFSGDEYFHPRPSAVSYNAAATGGTNWGASNPALRNRVLAQLGPIAKYGPKGARPGQPIGPDIEAWFQIDQFEGKPGIVAQWAAKNPDLAKAWVATSDSNAKYVEAWIASHPAEVARWTKGNPGTPQPKPEDVAVPFFTDFSESHPGMFPASVAHKTPDGKSETRIEPVKEGTDIQANFFGMWLQEHKDADLERVPSDMVMASGSGLDPDITLASALWQLDRVAAAWAKKTETGEKELQRQIEQLLRERSHAPLGGLFGVPLVNVLEMNLALREHYRKSAERGTMNESPVSQ
jgi:K+-transporting ATPase ATPase C chain